MIVSFLFRFLSPKSHQFSRRALLRTSNKSASFLIASCSSLGVGDDNSPLIPGSIKVLDAWYAGVLNGTVVGLLGLLPLELLMVAADLDDGDDDAIMPLIFILVMDFIFTGLKIGLWPWSNPHVVDFVTSGLAK